jgi:hypothetical protein
MKKLLLYFCCVIFLITAFSSFAQTNLNHADDVVPKITGEDYEKTESRIALLTKQLYEGDNFHALKQYPSSGFSCVKNDRSFQFNLMLIYECKVKKPYHLIKASLVKRGYINIRKKQSACVSVDIAFYDSKLPRAYNEFFPPSDYYLIYNDEGYLTEMNYGGMEEWRTIKFDKTGKIIDNKLDNKFSAEDKLENELIRKEFAQLAGKPVSQPEVTPITNLASDYCTKVPEKLLRSDIRSVLSRVEKYRIACMDGKVEPLLSHPIFIPQKPTAAELANPNFGGIHDQWSSSIHAFYSGEALAFVGVKGGNRRDCGFFLVFDDQLRFQRYVKGEVEFDYNSSGHNVGKTAKVPDNGSGIEIIFHKNGYPATYRSIVKKRLFGRQIEWNDKGEVMSDIDLDIPKELEEAPKENESKSK